MNWGPVLGTGPRWTATSEERATLSQPGHLSSYHSALASCSISASLQTSIVRPESYVDHPRAWVSLYFATSGIRPLRTVGMRVKEVVSQRGESGEYGGVGG